MAHHTRSRATTALLVTLLTLASGAAAGTGAGSTQPSRLGDRGIRVSADQAERRMSVCMRSAPRSADHYERHSLTCQARVAAGRL